MDKDIKDILKEKSKNGLLQELQKYLMTSEMKMF